MKDGNAHGGKDNALVCGEVQLDARKVAGRDRSAIADLALAGEGAARVGVDVEGLEVGGNLDAGPLVNPLADFGEGLFQKRLVEMRGIGQGEVEILGEAIGLEEALFQAGSALEQPVVGQRRMGADTGEHPAQHVVLFDDVGPQRHARRRFQYLAPVDHAWPLFAQ